MVDVGHRRRDVAVDGGDPRPGRRDPRRGQSMDDGRRARGRNVTVTDHSAAVRMAAHQSQRRQTTWSAVDLMATTFPEPRWAVPGIFAEGINLLAGAPKLGKSWLAARCGRCRRIWRPSIWPSGSHRGRRLVLGARGSGAPPATETLDRVGRRGAATPPDVLDRMQTPSRRRPRSDSGLARRTPRRSRCGHRCVREGARPGLRACRSLPDRLQRDVGAQGPRRSVRSPDPRHSSHTQGNRRRLPRRGKWHARTRRCS